MPIKNMENLYKKPADRENGALIVTFDVSYPDTQFSQEDKQLIENVFKKLEQQKPNAYNGLN